MRLNIVGFVSRRAGVLNAHSSTIVLLQPVGRLDQEIEDQLIATT